MRYILHPNLKKIYKKLSRKLLAKIDERLDLFRDDEFNFLLENHPLHGEYEGYRSINITGDYRALYFIKDNIAIFVKLGTHSELFGK